MPSRWTQTCVSDLKCHLSYSALYAIGLWAFYLVTGLFVVAALLFALVSRAPQDNRDHAQTVFVFGTAALACAGGIGWIVFGYDRRDTSMVLIAILLGVTLAVCAVVVASELLTRDPSTPAIGCGAGSSASWDWPSFLRSSSSFTPQFPLFLFSAFNTSRTTASRPRLSDSSGCSAAWARRFMATIRFAQYRSWSGRAICGDGSRDRRSLYDRRCSLRARNAVSTPQRYW